MYGLSEVIIASLSSTLFRQLAELCQIDVQGTSLDRVPSLSYRDGKYLKRR
ncbi:MAG: hypothetical protein V5788_06460 [Shewanella sp.]